MLFCLRAPARSQRLLQKLLKPPPFILACCSSADHQANNLWTWPRSAKNKYSPSVFISPLGDAHLQRSSFSKARRPLARPWIRPPPRQHRTQCVNNRQNVTRLRWPVQWFGFYPEQEWLFCSKVMRCRISRKMSYCIKSVFFWFVFFEGGNDSILAKPAGMAVLRQPTQ